MKKQIDLHDLDTRLKNIDEESHWNEEHSSKLKNRIFSDLKKSHSNKRTPYRYYVSLTIVGLLLWILVSPYMSKELNGFITTGAISGPTPVQISFIVFILFMMILVRKNKKMNHLFKKTDSFYMRSPFMRNFFGKGFRILVSIFVFYLLQKGLTYIDTIYENKIVYSLMFILAVMLSFWLGKKLFERLVSLRWHYPLQIVGSLLLFLFFSFQMFTPFFYQEEHLIDQGLKKIEMYYQLGDHQLSFSERSELVESIFTKTWNNAYLNRLSSEFAELELQNIEVTEFSRRFAQYELIVEVELYLIDQEPNIERSSGYFTFTREDGEFKIAGFQFKSTNGN